ncbi:MAG: hypothetical protein L0Y74_08125 [candidate division Zixibacteria bacterium]|nr:hypothetical protein [candidate division Zixibacteria bacterium]
MILKSKSGATVQCFQDGINYFIPPTGLEVFDEVGGLLLEEYGHSIEEATETKTEKFRSGGDE